MDDKKYVEVCFSPLLFPIIKDKSAIVVVVDVLRATSAICTAFENGLDKLIPVETIEEARQYKEDGYMVAAERDGIVKDFADFGNSPFNFTPERVAGQTIAYSTTNGTRTIHMAEDFHKIVIGSFLNLNALTEWLIKENHNVVILCAGWRGRFNIEDSLMAGALSIKLIEDHHFTTVCDSAYAAMDLWDLAKADVLNYLEKAAQRHRLKKNKLDDVIPFCFSDPNYSSIIPVYQNGMLLNNSNLI